MRNTEGRSGQLESGGSLILFTKHNEVRPLAVMGNERRELYIYIFLLVCFTSYFVFSIAVLPHSSSTQSIVETRDQNSRSCPLLFSNRNLGSFCA